MEEQHYVLGVDLSDTYVTAAVVDDGGHLVKAPQWRVIDRSRDAHSILHETVVPALQDAINRSEYRPMAVGLAVPGTLRPEEGLCILSTALGWEDVQVRDPVCHALNLPVVIVNDVRAMVTGERYFGAGQNIDNFVCVALGSHIEGGLVIDHRFYAGEGDSAGEVGHITVDLDGPSCACGNQGCLEVLASGPAVARMAAEAIKLGAQSVLTEWFNEDNPISAEMVHRAAREGDALAIKIWEKVGRNLGFGLSAVITIVNPRRIILGGKVARAFEFFAPAMREEVRRRARMVPRDYTELMASPLECNATLLGAARTALLTLQT